MRKIALRAALVMVLSLMMVGPVLADSVAVTPYLFSGYKPFKLAPNQSGDLTFNVAVATWQNGKLFYVPSIKVEVTSGGAVYDSTFGTGAGQVTFKIPSTAGSTITFTTGIWTRTLTSEFENGVLAIKDADNNNTYVESYLRSDGTLTLEYFRQAMMIFSPGDKQAPVLGRVSYNATVGLSGAPLLPMAPADDYPRFWRIVPDAYPNSSVWVDATYNGTTYTATATVTNPDGPYNDLVYHLQGTFNESEQSFFAFHLSATGEVDMTATGGPNADQTQMVGTFTWSDGSQWTFTGQPWFIDLRDGYGGGAEDHFGGGGVISLLPLPAAVSAGLNTAKSQGSEFSMNRVLAYSTPYAAAGPLQVVWTNPDGTSTTNLCYLGASGTFSNGITYTGALGENYGAAYFDLRLNLPAAVVAGLATGTHTIQYVFLDVNGLASNARTKTLIVN